MAIIPKGCIVLTDECGVFQYHDKNNWGSPEENRDQGANILLVASVDVDGVESFITVDSAPYLSKLIYDVNNTQDGHYLFETLRFRF